MTGRLKSPVAASFQLAGVTARWKLAITPASWKLAATGLVCALAVAGCGPSGGGGPGKGDVAVAPARDESLETAKRQLQSATDRDRIKLVLPLLNTHLGQHPEHRALPSADERALWESTFGLKKAEIDEIAATGYSTLDAAHLERCFLLRDAARSIDIDGLSAAEKAAAAFAWTTRQVLARRTNEPPTPAEFVLRRGWGNPTERGHVFLALLHQLGIDGCFVTSPRAAEPWACAAVVADKEGKETRLILFDHRLGIPLPGGKGKPDGDLARAFRRALPLPGPADGTEIATFAALRARPELLDVLKVDDKVRYDIAAEDIKAAQLVMAPPLSALAPRMRLLQDTLLPPTIRVRFAVDAAALTKALVAAAGADVVRADRDAVTLLRDFLPESAGGVGNAQRVTGFVLSVVPQESMPPQMRELEGEPLALIHTRFAQPFVVVLLERGGARDLLLRGSYREASEALTQALDQGNLSRSLRGVTPEVEADFAKWREAIYAAYGDYVRAQRVGADEVRVAQERIDETWKIYNKTLTILFEGAAAEPRRFHATRLLALVMHEQAEKAQFRSDRLAATPTDPAETARAKEEVDVAWRESSGWCRSFLQEFGSSAFGPSVRLLLARAQAALGDVKTARSLVEDADGTTDAEKAARLFLARRLK